MRLRTKLMSRNQTLVLLLLKICRQLQYYIECKKNHIRTNVD